MSKCDVLLLLDCCAAASAAPASARPTKITETIAACGFETWAPRPGVHSFTSILVEVLSEWANQPPFSAAMLHSEVLTRLKHERPKRNDKGDKFETRRTPTHIVSTTDPNIASITLAKMTPEDPRPSSNAPSDPIPTGMPAKTSGGGATADDRILESLLEVDEKGLRKSPHVLLSLALEEDQVLDVASCLRWLRQFPLLAKHVGVEGVYRSYSTLLLLSVPVVLWDLLPNHRACNFIGYVASENLTPKHKEGRSQPSAAIPIRGLHRFTEMGKVDGLAQTPSQRQSVDSGYASSGILVSPPRFQPDLRPTSRGVRPQSEANFWKMTQGRKNHVSHLLGNGRVSLLEIGPIPAEERSESRPRTKRLLVSVLSANVDNDHPVTTCVLSYGHTVQSTKPLWRATTNPVW
jgi:hypothetical protein